MHLTATKPNIMHAMSLISRLWRVQKRSISWLQNILLNTYKVQLIMGYFIRNRKIYICLVLQIVTMLGILMIEKAQLSMFLCWDCMLFHGHQRSSQL